GVAAFAYNGFHFRDQAWTTKDLVVFFGICTISVVWSWQAIEAVPELQATGHFPVWSDFFLQADQISRFSRLPTLAVKDFAFYHYASLMLPAVVRSLCPISAL